VGPSGWCRVHLIGFKITGCDVHVEMFSPPDGNDLADDIQAALLQASREQDPAYWSAG
jgi:hypothetical protein